MRDLLLKDLRDQVSIITSQVSAELDPRYV